MSKIAVNALLIFLVLCTACKDTTKEPTTNPAVEVPETKVEEQEAATPAKTEVYVWVDNLRLRAEPNTQSKTVTKLKEGQALIYKNERSDFTEKINLRGTLFDEPWLKIATNDGIEGWVYGGGVKFYKIGVDAAPTPYDDCFKLQKDRKMTQAAKCIERTRFRELKKDGSRVSELPNGITFVLSGGEKFTLNNIGRDSVYEFRYYLKKMEVFVVHAQYANKEDYLLVNDKTGKITRLKGFPKASKEGDYIACLNPNWGNKGNFMGIQLWGYKGNTLVVLFEESLKDFRPTSPKWVDENTLQFTLLEIADTKNRKSRYGQLTRDENGNWSRG